MATVGSAVTDGAMEVGGIVGGDDAEGGELGVVGDNEGAGDAEGAAVGAGPDGSTITHHPTPRAAPPIAATPLSTASSREKYEQPPEPEHNAKSPTCGLQLCG